MSDSECRVTGQPAAVIVTSFCADDRVSVGRWWRKTHLGELNWEGQGEKLFLDVEILSVSGSVQLSHHRIKLLRAFRNKWMKEMKGQRVHLDVDYLKTTWSGRRC